MRAPRTGELIAFAGAACIGVSLALRWYQTPGGSLGAWDTFGVAVLLLMLAGAAGVALMGATVLERTPAVPVAAAVWTVVLGLAGSIAAIVRVLERPHGASSLCGGAWLGLAGALLVLCGAWLSMRDERTGRYPPAEPPSRKPPPTAP
jgi:hypothetical protein